MSGYVYLFHAHVYTEEENFELVGFGGCFQFETKFPFHLEPSHILWFVISSSLKKTTRNKNPSSMKHVYFFFSSSSSLILILVFVNISIINIIITRRKLVNFRFDPCVFVCFQCIFLNFIIIVIENRSVCVCVVYRFWINIINFFLLIRFICFSSIWIRVCVWVWIILSSFEWIEINQPITGLIEIHKTDQLNSLDS